jgi:uncharacterized protein YcfL
MRKFLSLLLALLLLTGCKSKKLNKTEHREEQRSERKEVKDSSTRVEKAQKVSAFDLQQSQSYEITLESDKDSVGNSKELVYYRIRNGDNETIRVSGGKVKITTKSSLSNSLIEAKATLTNTVIQTSKEERRISEAITMAYKTKEVKGIIKWWWVVVVLLAVWIGWRYKLFRF